MVMGRSQEVSRNLIDRMCMGWRWRTWLIDSTAHTGFQHLIQHYKLNDHEGHDLCPETSVQLKTHLVYWRWDLWMDEMLSPNTYLGKVKTNKIYISCVQILDIVSAVFLNDLIPRYI